MPISYVAAGIAAVGLISSFLGSKKASKAAKEQAAEEARLEGIVTTERLRQLGKEERSLYGETVAGYAGGGVLATTGAGSVSRVLQEQRVEFAFEKEVTREAGASRVQQALLGGKSISDQYKYAGISNAASGLSSLLFALKSS